MYYYNNEMPPQQGWICPKCGRVNAPWLPTCDCVSSQTRATFDTISLTDRKTEPQTERVETMSCQECKWWFTDSLKHGGYCQSFLYNQECRYEPQERSK